MREDRNGLTLALRVSGSHRTDGYGTATRTFGRPAGAAALTPVGDTPVGRPHPTTERIQTKRATT